MRSAPVTRMANWIRIAGFGMPYARHAVLLCPSAGYLACQVIAEISLACASEPPNNALQPTA